MKRFSPQRLRRASAALLSALVLSFLGSDAEAASPVPMQAVGSQGASAPAASPPAVWTGSTEAGPGATVSVLGSTTVSTPGLPAFDTPLALIVKVDVPQTGVSELFLLQIPAAATTQPAPVLMAFHGYNVTYLDVLFNTTFLEETRRRGWFLAAPLQISNAGQAQINYASVQSQWHVEAVLGFLIDQFAIDLDRLYAVGFSMGGGSAMSYAARHRDREKGAFAAVINHTGSVALGHVYENVNATVQGYMRDIFGDAPSVVPFEYQRSSVIEIDPATDEYVDGGRHMALNLMDVPVRTYHATTDGNTYLVTQCNELSRYMDDIGANHDLRPLPADCPSGVMDDHCWQTVPEYFACNWLDQHSLAAPPTNASYLVDRSGERWGAFRVDLDDAADFGSFRYQLLAVTNTLIIEQVSNVHTLEIDIAALGLDPTADLFLLTESTEDFQLVFTGATQPVDVQRLTQQTPQNCPPTFGAASWCFQGTVLTLNEIGDVSVVDWLIDLP